MRGLYLGGTWEEGQGLGLRSLNPATGEPVWEGRASSDRQTARAFEAASEVFTSWSAMPLAERVAVAQRFGALVEDHKDELARVISLETGKPLWESLSEVASMVAKVGISIRAYEERTGVREQDAAGVRSLVRHRAHGVLAVLGPYNFPCHLPNGHVVPALLAGNCVVFKPSEHTPYCAEKMVELWSRAGLMPGALNLLQGDAKVGRLLARDPRLDGLLFTGSAAAGHALHRHFAGQPEKILALEMGGNNPLLVDEVRDRKAAIYAIIQSAYVTAGQRCSCARRLFVPNSDGGRALVGELVEALKRLRVGAFDDPEPAFMGPVISERAAAQLCSVQEALRALGGSPLLEMKRLKSGTGFLSPGLIDVTGLDVPDEEHFGPLLQLVYYDDFEQAIDAANATRFGLAAGLLSDDRSRYETFLQRIVAGVVNWNRPLTGASSAAPFGGVGASGNHRPSAYYAADYSAYPVASLEQDRLMLPETLSPGVVL